MWCGGRTSKAPTTPHPPRVRCRTLAASTRRCRFWRFRVPRIPCSAGCRSITISMLIAVPLLMGRSQDPLGSAGRKDAWSCRMPNTGTSVASTHGLQSADGRPRWCLKQSRRRPQVTQKSVGGLMAPPLLLDPDPCGKSPGAQCTFRGVHKKPLGLPLWLVYRALRAGWWPRALRV